MLENAFKNVFKKMFVKENYLSTLLALILFGILTLILFFSLFGFSIFNFIASGAIYNLDLSLEPLTILTTVLGSIYLIGLFLIVTYYLFFVLHSFVVNRLTIKSKDIFIGVGKAFKKGTLLFLGTIIIITIAMLVILLLSLTSYIPVAGITIARILILTFSLIICLSLLLLLGYLGKGVSFGKSLSNALLIPFKNIKVFGYFLVFGLGFVVLNMVFSLIFMIPVVGLILCFFTYPFLLLYFCGAALELTNIN